MPAVFVPVHTQEGYGGVIGGIVPAQVVDNPALGAAGGAPFGGVVDQNGFALAKQSPQQVRFEIQPYGGIRLRARGRGERQTGGKGGDEISAVHAMSEVVLFFRPVSSKNKMNLFS